MTKKFRGDHTRYGQTSNMSEHEMLHARAGHGGGFSGTRSKRTKRRQEFLAEQERHAMDKPKELKDQTDGDLLEVKKDPEETKKAWEVWLDKKISEPDPVKDAPDPNRSIIGAKDEEDYKRRKQGLGGKGGCRGVGCDKKATKKLIAWVRDHEAGTTPEKPILSDRMHKEIINVCPDCHKRALDIKERDEKKIQEDANKTYVTKPIPDSKGGKGSFQHCINANKDKKNPGGWCKQIERKIGKGKDEGEEEEVKISTYKKLTRIKDRLQAHKKKGLGALGRGKLNPYTGKKTKLGKLKEQYKLEDFESEKKIDEKARKKRESKEAAIPFNPKSESTDTWNCDLCNIEIPNDSDADKRKKRHADFHVDETDKPEGRHRNWTFGNAKFTLGKEKKKTDKCPGCDGEGKKWHIGPAFIAPHSTECPGCKGRGKLTPTQQQDKEAKVADDKQFNKLTDKTDYFVEEIRANIIYHNKIFPLVGMVAAQVARGVGPAAKKVGGDILGEVGDMAKEQSEEEQ